MTTLPGLSSETLYEVIKTCASLSEVRKEVLRNHDDNRWWPLSVVDWRLRLVIAGWSTRVSYSMITTYQTVVSDVTAIGYDRLVAMSDDEVECLLHPLGLSRMRTQFLRSVELFLLNNQLTAEHLKEMDNDTLVSCFATQVRGSGYKVAQCAILYAKGYHCGIFPVDSGMKDMLGPCIGILLPKGPSAHEVMRKQLELLINVDAEKYRALAVELGYGELEIPQNQAPIWWAHLVLIYFKRQYCNKHTPHVCPLRSHVVINRLLGTMCHREEPEPGGYRYILLEGIDRAGKSTIADHLDRNGFNVLHAPYNPHHQDIAGHYRDLIQTTSVSTVFDRSFISELVYGPIMRGTSRLSTRDFEQLTQLLAARGFIVLYVHEDLETLRARMQASMDEHSDTLKHLPDILEAYEECMHYLSHHLPVVRVRPSQVPPEQLNEHVAQQLNLWQLSRTRTLIGPQLQT